MQSHGKQSGRILHRVAQVGHPQKCMWFSSPVRPVLRKTSDSIIRIKDHKVEYISLGHSVLKLRVLVFAQEAASSIKIY